MSIGERIRARRNLRSLTVGQVAALVGKHKSWVSRVENGRIPPRFDDLEALARALNCGVRDLVPPKRAA